MGHFTLIEHTADAGIQVEACSLKDLFHTAAQGMIHLVCPHGRTAQTEIHSITVCGEDPAELLVNWLSELNYLFQVEQFLFAELHHFEIISNRLSTTVGGERIDPLRHPLRAEIKGVTYHKMNVEQITPGKWHALLYFDL